jgi:hypothetical protein
LREGWRVVSFIQFFWFKKCELFAVNNKCFHQAGIVNLYGDLSSGHVSS